MGLRNGAREPSTSDATALVGVSAIPGADRAASALSDADYADAFSLATGVVASPEQWARAMFGDVPGPAQQFIWRGLLGIRLRRGRSPRTVAGWRIAAASERWVRLEAASWFLSAELVVRTFEGGVSLSTFVRYDRAAARIVWPPLSAVHRLLIPGVLRTAVEIRSRDQRR
ncbi:hypothetical protein [Microbacterium sp. NPDC056234]|uniref:hypothetical protein n=1 Tax=Microbacterium sp. NPDC056234 TaxID=3345757 RepID=UPI0035E1E01B